MGEIRSAQEDLTKAFQDAGQHFYQQSQDASATSEASEPAAAGASAGAPADDVVEADYEIVDDGKK
jgi:molecular chaperone DnaK